jgi:hypothetical protein
MRALSEWPFCAVSIQCKMIRSIKTAVRIFFT